MTCPTVIKLADQGCQVLWAVKFPSSMTKQGAVYRATTYPDSPRVSLETWNTMRPVSEMVARKKMPLIRAALLKAGELVDKIERRVAAYKSRGHTIYAGDTIADELQWVVNKLRERLPETD